MTTSRLNNMLSVIDEINNQDPNQVKVAGKEQAKELLYGHQMSQCLAQYWPDANELLQIAVRAQHIKRWHLKRSDFDLGKTGYFKWRKALGRFHAELTAQEMIKHNYSAEEAQQTAAIIRKENFKANSDSQTLEDVACLVFLQHYFADFAANYIAKNNEEKIIRIVQKTWGKMSEQGHKIALSLTLPKHLAALIEKALA